jgi:hypothetical protein
MTTPPHPSDPLRLEVALLDRPDAAPDAVRRLAPRLLVSTPAALPAPPLQLPASLLLILEERHEQDAWLAASHYPIGFLLQPVSARRLRDAVHRLRGPATGPDPPPARRDRTSRQ